jgi:hypothetical protein
LRFPSSCLHYILLSYDKENIKDNITILLDKLDLWK